MPNLLLVGRDRIFREALATVIPLRVPECAVPVQTSSRAQTLTLLSRYIAIDGAIVDLNLPIDEPIDLVYQLRKHRGGVPVVVLIGATTAHLKGPLQEVGATFVFDKSGPLADIIEGIRQLSSFITA